MSEPQISIQIVQHIAACLEISGHDPVPLLRQLGIAPELLGDMEAMVPLRLYVAFFEQAADTAGNPHFGLQAARFTNSESLGPLSFLFLSAPTLRDGCEGFSRYLNAMQEGSRNRFIIDAERVRFEYGILDDTIRPRRHDSEYSVSATCNLVRQYAGPDFVPMEVHFEHSRIGSYARYEAYFQCPVFFSQPANRLIFSADYLDKGSGGLSSRLYPIIASHLQAMLRRREHPDRVADQVLDMLDPNQLQQVPTLGEIARRLRCSTATLSRHLAREGTSYRDLVTSRRMATAERLLADGDRSVADIAMSVGYAENASFTRAFRAHSGMTPTDYRAAVLKYGRTGQERVQSAD